MLTEDELLQGLEQIEERWPDKRYSRIEHEILHEKYGWMTAEDWERFCGLVMTGSDWFPPGKRFDEFFDGHRREFPPRPKVRVSCDECGGNGVREWVKRGKYGDIDERAGHYTSVARCRCANGGNWPAYPTMATVEKRKDFVRWVGLHEPSVDARANPHGKGREPGEEG